MKDIIIHFGENKCDKDYLSLEWRGKRLALELFYFAIFKNYKRVFYLRIGVPIRCLPWLQKLGLIKHLHSNRK